MCVIVDAFISSFIIHLTFVCVEHQLYAKHYVSPWKAMVGKTVMMSDPQIKIKLPTWEALQGLVQNAWYMGLTNSVLLTLILCSSSRWPLKFFSLPTSPTHMATMNSVLLAPKADPFLTSSNNRPRFLSQFKYLYFRKAFSTYLPRLKLVLSDFFSLSLINCILWALITQTIFFFYHEECKHLFSS